MNKKKCIIKLVYNWTMVFLIVTGINKVVPNLGYAMLIACIPIVLLLVFVKVVSNIEK